MRSRYPKHYWPEDPLTAQATRATTKRAMEAAAAAEGKAGIVLGGKEQAAKAGGVPGQKGTGGGMKRKGR
jgi:hypothetical protein